MIYHLSGFKLCGQTPGARAVRCGSVLRDSANETHPRARIVQILIGDSGATSPIRASYGSGDDTLRWPTRQGRWSVPSVWQVQASQTDITERVVVDLGDVGLEAPEATRQVTENRHGFLPTEQIEATKPNLAEAAQV